MRLRMRIEGVPASPGRFEGSVHLEEGREEGRPDARNGVLLTRTYERLAELLGANPSACGAALVSDPRPPPQLRPRLAGPIVGGVPFDLFVERDRLDVDGSRGWVDLPDVEEVPVVTAFLVRSGDEVLLLRRSDKVGSFRGRWAAVSGYLEQKPPRAQAVQEIQEETGIPESALALEREGLPVRTRQGAVVYTVYPFRFRVDRPDVEIDWEHTGFEWVDPAEIGRRETVPRLLEAWTSVQ